MAALKRLKNEQKNYEKSRINNYYEFNFFREVGKVVMI